MAQATSKARQANHYHAPGRSKKARAGLALSLSGGGARGLAHIGALEVLDEHGIQIAAISGASMGGVVGALYASGLNGIELHKIAATLSNPRQLLKLIDIGTGRRGLVSASKLRQLMGQYLDPDLTFDDLQIPLALKATDVLAGRQVDLTKGKVLDAVLATSAFPGVFPPVELEGRTLVDGGVLNNLPIDLLEEYRGSPVIAIDVSPQPFGAEEQQYPSIIERMPMTAKILYRSTMLMNHAITEEQIEEHPPDLLIEPDIPSEIGVFNGFNRAEEIVHYGRSAMETSLHQVNILSGTLDQALAAAQLSPEIKFESVRAN